MLTDKTSYISRHNSDFSDNSVSNVLGSLYEFLRDAELQDYFADLHMKLKVRSIGQLKYVDDVDLQSIGMTRPEMRRLKKFFNKEFPKTAMDKIKKRLTRTSRSISVPRPGDLSSRSVSFASGSSQNGPLGYPMEGADLPTMACVTNLSNPVCADTGQSGGGSWPLGKCRIPQSQLTLGPLLEHGHISDVYKGNLQWAQGQFPVAIKVVSKVSLKGDLGDFLKEISKSCSLDHQNVVKLYGLSLDEVSIYMVSELAPCSSLANCLSQPDSKKKYPVTTLYGFSMKICEGMVYLEERGVAHGRLIGSNVLLFPDNQPKITDAGMYRANPSISVNDKDDACMWVSPEVIKGCKESLLSDIWSFGVLLWEIFSYFQPPSPPQSEAVPSNLLKVRPPQLTPPDLCPSSIFQIMNLCWKDIPKDRPTFLNIHTQLEDLEPEEVVALTDGPDSAPHNNPDLALEYHGGMYSVFPNMKMLLYKSNAKIIVLDRGIGNSADLLRGCLPTGESGFLRWSNVRSIGITVQSTKRKSSEPSPVVSSRSNSNVIGGTFSKLRISRRDSKKKLGRLSIDMIGSPLDDFRHVGHVGPDGDVFGDLTSLYSNSGQKNSKSESVTSKTETRSNASSLAYDTLDGDRSKVAKSKELRPLPEIQTDLNSCDSFLNNDNEFNVYNSNISMFDELSMQWDMQASKFSLGTSKSSPVSSHGQVQHTIKSPVSSHEYYSVYEENCKSAYDNLDVTVPKKDKLNAVDNNGDSLQPECPSSKKSSIMNKFKAFGTVKKSKDASDAYASPVYAKINKANKTKKSEVPSDSRKSIISNPIIITGPVDVCKDDPDVNSLDFSSEVSSLQPSPRDSSLCLLNSAFTYSGYVDPNQHLNRQHSNITNSSRGRTSDSTATNVSPASSLTSLTSAPVPQVLQGGAALRALRKGDCVFRATSAANTLNRKRPSVPPDQSSNAGTMTRTRPLSSQLSNYSVKVSASTTDHVDDRKDIQESMATTPVTSDLPPPSSFETGMQKENIRSTQDSYNQPLSVSFGADANDRRRHSELMEQRSQVPNRNLTCRSSITEETDLPFEKGKWGALRQDSSTSGHRYNFPKGPNMFVVSDDNDEIAL